MLSTASGVESNISAKMACRIYNNVIIIVIVTITTIAHNKPTHCKLEQRQKQRPRGLSDPSDASNVPAAKMLVLLICACSSKSL